MSASEKKAARNEKRRQEEQKDRRMMTLYTAIGVVVAIAAVLLLVWNSGLLQRGLTAMEINGTKYTAADLQYYYNSVYSTYANQYVFDTTVSVRKQQVGSEGSYTWHDAILDEARTSLKNSAVLAAKARAKGFTLPEDAQAQLNSFINQLDTAWISSGYSSRAALIKANFGSYMTYDRLVSLISQEYLATSYASAQLEAIEHSDAECDAYYQEHTDELDTIVYTQLTFRAQVPATDADGNAVELTDEEKAARLETLKAEQKALAEEVKAKLEGGADVEAVSQEYADQLYSASLSRRSTGTSVSYSTYADWLLDSARRAGDVTLTEYEVGDSIYYYVAVFHERLRDDENIHSVRHILVQAGDGTSDPTQAEYDEAETQAKALLDEWKAGEATEDSFAALASANSDDTGSVSTGGLYSDVTPYSSYADSFKEWATASSRRTGDTGLVKTIFGWHVMYYVDAADPAWKQTALSALQKQDYEQLVQDAGSGIEAKQGMGMSLVTAK